MENNVSLALEEPQKISFEDYHSDEFAIAKMSFLGSNPNAHNLEISEDVLMECADSVKGKWLVSKMNFLNTDMEGHEPTEQIMGIIPKDQDVEFVRDDNGYLRAVVDVVVSKVYAKEFCEVLLSDVEHAVSVEMSVKSKEGRGMNDVVESFNIIGVTVLGRSILPSCKGANIEFVRFAENAESYFGETRLAATKKNTEDIKSNNTAEKFSVVDKKEKRKEGESKMAEIEFAAVNIGELWSSLYNALRYKYEGYDYCIKDIYEEGGQKFALIHKYGEDTLYRIDFTLTEDGLTLSDEMTKVEIEVIETDEIRKFAEPEDVEQYRTFAEPEEEKDKEEENKDEPKQNEEDERTKMSERIAELEAELSEKNTVISENEVKMSVMDDELTELREFKRTAMEAKKMSKIEVVMSKYSSFMTEEEANSYKAEGLQCDFAALDGWANKVAASVADTVIKQKSAKKDDEDFTRMSFAKYAEKDADKAGTPLERLKNKYL